MGTLLSFKHLCCPWAELRIRRTGSREKLFPVCIGLVPLGLTYNYLSWAPSQLTKLWILRSNFHFARNRQAKSSRVYIESTHSKRSLQNALEAVNVGFESTLFPPCSNLPKEHITLRKEKNSVMTSLNTNTYVFICHLLCCITEDMVGLISKKQITVSTPVDFKHFLNHSFFK